MRLDQRRDVISKLNGCSEIEAFEAAKSIWVDPDERLASLLIRTLKKGLRPFNRTAAAFAMQIVTTPRTVRALETALKNKTENSRVRGEAAEALAHGHRKKSHDILLIGLLDPNQDVRFWCAFALGEMAEKRALPALKHIAANDRRVVKGFHSVAKEAADAIENILSKKSMHARKSRCLFCAID